jgi:hypothetical protein
LSEGEKEKEKEKEKLAIHKLLKNFWAMNDTYHALPSRSLTTSLWPNLAAIKRKEKGYKRNKQ